MTPSDEPRRDGGGAGRVRGATLWALAALPLVLLGGLLGVLFWSGPLDVVRGEGYPPVEELAFQRVELGPEGIVATVLNDGPDPVTIAQVQVDEAYWSFTAEPGTTLAHLGRTTLTIPYPWVEGDAHALRLVTSTGVTFDHEVAVAVETPTPDARFFGIFTLIGLYVGVIPVAIGLLWLPLVSRVGRTGLDFLLALTIGLLLFLLVEAGHDGLEAAARAPSSFQGVALFVFGALAAFVGLETVGGWLRARRRATGASAGRGWILAQMVATGIGLHNLGEGLAVGVAYGSQSFALATVLIFGFAVHNVSEGIAIVSPISRSQVDLRTLALLGLLAGGPTIIGTLIGIYIFSNALSIVFFAIAAGAILYVIIEITTSLGDRFRNSHLNYLGVMAGFTVMYLTSLLVLL